MWGDMWETCREACGGRVGELAGGHAGGGGLFPSQQKSNHMHQNTMLLHLSVIRALYCQAGWKYQLGGGVQTNQNLPKSAQK